MREVVADIPVLFQAVGQWLAQDALWLSGLSGLAGALYIVEKGFGGTHPLYTRFFIQATNRRPVARNLEPGTCLIPRDEGRSFLFRKSSRIMSKRGSDQFKRPEIPMRFEDFSFGSIRIDGTTYEHDVVIDRGQIRKRKEKAFPKVS
jgi:hypothetical protein